MTDRRDRLAALAAGAVAGVAAWCSFGTLTVADAAPRAPRLGLLPHPGLLAVCALAGAATAWFLHHRSGLRRVPGWYLPLFCSSIVVLPWLPVSLPATALLWAGPAAVWVWAGILVAIVVAAVRAEVVAAPALFARWFEPSRAAWTAAIVAAILYGGAAVRLAPLFPGGDEPHYLVITQSVLKDGDLRIENNHRQRDYLEYFQGTIRPDYLRRGIDRAIYSIHAPGLPVLVVPAFAIGGYTGVVIFLVAIAALASLLVWRAAYLAAGTAGAAWFAWAGVTVSGPILFHAFAVYPETTGAALVMTGVATLAALDQATRLEAGSAGAGARPAGPLGWPAWRWLLLGTGLALLPWLHTRYVVAACALGLVLAIRLAAGRRAATRLASLFAVPAVSAAAWFGFFKIIYGTFSPSAPYGHYTQTKLAHVPVALPALLFDQQFGLLPNAPFYALALAGLVPLARTRRRLAVELLALVLAYAAAVAAYRMWWGGWSAPARFLVPVLPALAVPAAAWWGSSRAGGRAVGSAALVLTALVSLTVLVAERGWLVFNSRDTVSRLYEWLSPVVDLNRALPSFFRPDLASPLLAASVWLAVLVTGALALAAASRRTRLGAAAFGAAVIATAIVAVMAASALVWRVERSRPLAPADSQIAALERTSSAGLPVGVSFRPLALESPSRLITRLRLAASTRRPRADGSPAYMLAPVPPGLYRLDGGSVAAVTGTLDVRIGRGVLPVERWTLDPRTRAVDRTLRLPCGVNAVVIDGDEGVRRAASRLVLQPLETWRGDECPAERARAAARYAGTIVFFFDEAVFVEEGGFWVRGKEEALIVVSPDSRGRTVRLSITGGAVAQRVAVVSGAWRDRLDLGRYEERLIDVPLDPQTGSATIRIGSDAGFRPAETDPPSQDQRLLGCWVTIPS